MTKMMSGFVGGMVTGAAVGAAVGLVVTGKKAQTGQFKRKATKALRSIGGVMDAVGFLIH